MESKETNLRTKATERRIEDAEYYKYIFKKTEKIVCAVFYILEYQGHDTQDTIKDILEKQAQTLLDTTLASLKDTRATTGELAHAIRYELAALESKLRVACAAQRLSGEYLDVFVREIDAVQRSLRRYLDPKMENPLFVESGNDERVLNVVRRERKVLGARPRERIDGLVEQSREAGAKSRRDRVLDVLREKGEATIKDITDVIKDCSEKTIQRELMGLIKDNMILREGERRWSKYRII